MPLTPQSRSPASLLSPSSRRDAGPPPPNWIRGRADTRNQPPPCPGSGARTTRVAQRPVGLTGQLAWRTWEVVLPRVKTDPEIASTKPHLRRTLARQR